MAKYLLPDTGFWIALFYPRDSHHENAQILADLLDLHNLVVPWPCLYETLDTRLVRRRESLAILAAYLTRSSTITLSDEPYRRDALHTVLRNETPGRNISLVDEVIRLTLQDRNVKVDAIITFNPRDFHDVCLSRQIELISD